jgi:hypothetical protein
MSSPLSPAMAWALASKVALIDARHCDPLTAAEKRAEAAALFARASELDDAASVRLSGRLSLCLQAQAYMESQVKPAAHYRPTKRRTKPASLPQRLAEAAHAIKEP